MEKHNDPTLYRVAVQRRWPVSEATKAKAIAEMEAVLNSAESSAREKTSAVKVLLAAELQNQNDEHFKNTDDSGARLTAIAAKLGISITSETDAQGSGDRNIAVDDADRGEVGEDDGC